MAFKREKWELRQMQAMPLSAKIRMTAARIESWYEYYASYSPDWDDDGPPGIYLSFSGGKDSTVLLDILKNHCIGVYDCPCVFVDTGLEYPEVRTFALERADVVLKPAMNFRQVILTYGYPVIGKAQARAIRDLRNAHGQNDATVNLRLTGYNRKGQYCPSYKLADKWVPLKDAPFNISEQCCDVMKKAPFKKYEKETGRKPIVGSMCVESRLRENAWLANGCNAFDAKKPMSQPMAFWTEKDVLHYLWRYRVPYASVYGEIHCKYNGKDCPDRSARRCLEENPNKVTSKEGDNTITLAAKLEALKKDTSTDFLFGAAPKYDGWKPGEGGDGKKPGDTKKPSEMSCSELAEYLAANPDAKLE